MLIITARYLMNIPFNTLPRTIFLAVLFGAVSLIQTGCNDRVLPDNNDNSDNDPAPGFRVVYNQIFLHPYPDIDRIGMIKLDNTNYNAIPLSGDQLISSPPGGNTIAIIDSRGRSIDIIDLKTGNIIRRIDHRYGTQINYQSASLSPAGDKVAYSVEYDDANNAGHQTETRRVVIADIDGPNYVLLDVGARQESYTRFSPDGTHVAFFDLDSAGDGDNGWLYVAKVDGSETRKIADVRGIPHDGEMIFSWSPDGANIVFTEDKTTLCIAPVDGSGKYQLTEGNYPHWSPDGRTIVYYDHNSKRTSIWDVSGYKVITELDVAGLWPRWSPDGTQILLFTFDPSLPIDEQLPTLAVVNVETREQTELAAGGAMGFWMQ